MLNATEPTYTLIPNLVEAQAVPPEGILSRAIYKDETLKAVLFALDAGQELSEHTAAQPAVVQIVKGRARLTLDGAAHEVGPGAWVRLPARLRHGLRAETPLIMLLLLLRPPQATAEEG